MPGKYIWQVNHVPHLLMTVSATSAGIGLGALTGGQLAGWVGVAVGSLTVVVNFTFWCYLQWGRTQRENFAAWRDAQATELAAQALAKAKDKLLVDDAAAAQLVAAALATARCKVLVAEASEDALDRAAERAVQRALATGSKS